MATVLDKLVVLLGAEYDPKGAKDLEASMKRVGSSMQSAGLKMAALGAAVTAAFAVTVNAAKEWESSFTGVRKTVDGTEAELLAIEDALRSMAKTKVPLSHKEIAQIAETGGQLGIATDSLVDFTEVMAKLGVTTTLSSEEAATSLAQMANVMGTSQDDFDRMGATIVDLGNNLATTESKIVAMAQRLAGQARQIGLSEAETFAFAGALASVGIEAEAGGTAFSRFMVEMQKAVERGGKELDVFSETAGVSASEFSAVFRDDAAGAIELFMKGMKRMIDAGETVNPLLEDLSLDGMRVADALKRGSAAADLMGGALARGKKAWEENTALNKEAALRFKTFDSELTFVKNTIYDMAISIGTVLLPPIRRFFNFIKPIIDAISKWAEENETLTTIIASMGVALLGIGTTLLVLGTAIQMMAPFAGIFLALKNAVIGWSIATHLATAAQWLFNAAMTANPIGLIIVGIGLLVAALAGLIIYWDDVLAAAKAALGWIAGMWNKVFGKKSMEDASAERREADIAMQKEKAMADAAEANLFADEQEFKAAEEVATEKIAAAQSALARARASDSDAGWNVYRAAKDEADEAAEKAALMADKVLESKESAAQQRQKSDEALAAFTEAEATEREVAEVEINKDEMTARAREAGKSIPQTMSEGIESQPGVVRKSMEGELDDVSPILPSSDAQEGPLSILMDAGKAIMDTIASGVNLAEPLRNVLAKAMVLPSGEGIGAQLSGLTDKLITHR